jgi:hypothetical protein
MKHWPSEVMLSQAARKKWRTNFSHAIQAAQINIPKTTRTVAPSGKTAQKRARVNEVFNWSPKKPTTTSSSSSDFVPASLPLASRFKEFDETRSMLTIAIEEHAKREQAKEEKMDNFFRTMTQQQQQMPSMRYATNMYQSNHFPPNMAVYQSMNTGTKFSVPVIEAIEDSDD